MEMKMEMEIHSRSQLKIQQQNAKCFVIADVVNAARPLSASVAVAAQQQRSRAFPLCLWLELD